MPAPSVRRDHVVRDARRGDGVSSALVAVLGLVAALVDGALDADGGLFGPVLVGDGFGAGAPDLDIPEGGFTAVFPLTGALVAVAFVGGVGLLVGTRRMDVGAAGVGCSCAWDCAGWQAVTVVSSSVVAMV